MNLELNVTLILCVSIVIVSLIGMNDMNFKYKMMMSPERVKHQGEWYRIFTHGWVHADYLHLFFNVYVLYNFGHIEEIPGYNIPPGTEDALLLFYGKTGYLMYSLLFLGGLFAASIPSMKKHSDNSSYWSLGASGAVSAVIFAFIILNPVTPLSLLFIPVPIPAWIFGILYMAFEYYANNKGRTNIAHDAHLFGGLFGIMYIFVVIPGSAQNLIQQITG